MYDAETVSGKYFCNTFLFSIVIIFYDTICMLHICQSRFLGKYKIISN